MHMHEYLQASWETTTVLNLRWWSWGSGFRRPTQFCWDLCSLFPKLQSKEHPMKLSYGRVWLSEQKQKIEAHHPPGSTVATSWGPGCEHESHNLPGSYGNNGKTQISANAHGILWSRLFFFKYCDWQVKVYHPSWMFQFVWDSLMLLKLASNLLLTNILQKKQDFLNLYMYLEHWVSTVKHHL